MTDTIRVRDRRNPHQYTVHNRLIDEWYPIISSHGLALYSLYSRMASKGQEHCYPGLRMIASHMGMGVSTVSDYNSLLVWCDLLYIVPGSLTDNRASDYYLLEVPAVTPTRLHDIAAAVHAEIERLAADREQDAQRLVAAGMATAAAKLRQANGSAFPRTVLRRLEKWQPLQNYWQQQPAKPTIVTPGQAPLPLEGYPQAVDNSAGGVRQQDQGDPPVGRGVRQQDQGDPPVGRGVRQQDHNNPNQQSKSTIQINNPTTTGATGSENDTNHVVAADLLRDFGVEGDNLQRLSSTEPATALAWIWRISHMAGLANPAGYLVVRLENQQTPPAEYLALAHAWLQMDQNEHADLLAAMATARDARSLRWSLAEDLELSDKALHLALRLREKLREWQINPLP